MFIEISRRPSQLELVETCGRRTKETYAPYGDPAPPFPS